MLLSLFIKGAIIGFAIAAPVGPIAVLCIQRSLQDGFKIGLMTGLGAAFADGTYGLIAGFGLTALASLLIHFQFWIRLIGGIFLIYLGIKLFRMSPRERSVKNFEHSAGRALFSSFLLTLTNPATILSFFAVFVGLGLSKTTTDYIHALTLVFGIIFGSALWWVLLSGGVAFILRHRLNPAVMRGINRFSGIIILAFGVFALSMK
jgi:threonine/homoserine/homoserine lactone efflux protein